MTGLALGETTRAWELIAGDPDSIRTTASKLNSRADRTEAVGRFLLRLDLTGVWEGQAATSFSAAVSELQPHVDFTAEADRAAARALDVYARTLEDAQINAGRAIEMWADGTDASKSARRNTNIALYGASNELMLDPGEEQRAHAQRILQLARDDVADAGDRAASALHDTSTGHAATLGFWDVVGATVNVTLGNDLRAMGNGLASFANAMSEHPDEMTSMLVGLFSMQFGMDGFVGGLAADATGAGAPVGVAVNVASVGLVVGGADVTLTSMSKLMQQAAGEDHVEPFVNDAAGGPQPPAGYQDPGLSANSRAAFEDLEHDAAKPFADKAEARAGLSGDLRAAANRFFKGATSKSENFSATELPNGGYRLQFFSPANNAGFGKLYVQEIDSSGAVIRRFKDTLGPEGLVEKKWVSGGPE